MIKRVVRLLLCVCAPAPLYPLPLPAQSRAEPSLVFSISMGLTTGQHLWSVGEQVLVAPGATFDTVAISRNLRPNLTASLGATLYRSPNLGWTAEIGYFGVGSEQRCAGPAVWRTDSQNINEQACTRAQGLHKATSVVGFQFGAHYRFVPQGALQPYVRLSGGPALLGNSYVQTSGSVIATPGCTPQPCELRLLDEASRPTLTWLVSGTAGITVAIGPAYRLRMEVRDVVTSLPVVTAAAPPGVTGNIAPTGRRVVHVPTFMFGLDLVFERRRPRRY